MIFAKEVTYGLEKQIKNIQCILFSYLSKKWAGEIEIYGIIQRNNLRDGIVPEAYIGDNEYKQIFVNDKITSTIAFDVIGRSYDGYYNRADVECMCSVDIEKAHGNKLRDIDLILTQFKDGLLKTGLVYEIGEIKEYIRDVFSNYDITKLKYRDMQPFYIFSFNTTIEYSDDNEC